MEKLKIVRDILGQLWRLPLMFVVFIPALLLVALINNIGKLIALVGSVIERFGENIEYIFRKLTIKVGRCGDKIFLE